MKGNSENSALRYSAVLLAPALAILLSACESVALNGDIERAVVCPKCKTVETVAWLSAGPSFTRPGISAYGVNGLYPSPSVRKHECPRCQGAFTTLARHGKWEHRCSICREGAFSCPIIHPTESPRIDERL